MVVVVGRGHQKILSSNTVASHTYCAVLRGDIKASASWLGTLRGIDTPTPSQCQEAGIRTTRTQGGGSSPATGLVLAHTGEEACCREAGRAEQDSYSRDCYGPFKQPLD